MKSELVPTNGDPPIPITRDLTVVGRREFCDVVVNDPSLSKRHCVLVRTDGLLVMRDLGTTNGTKVNGQRVTWAALLPNDRLTLGRYKVRVYLGPDDVPSPSEQSSDAAGSGTRMMTAGAVMQGFNPPRGRAAVDDEATGFAAPSPLSVPTLRGQSQRNAQPPSDDAEDDVILLDADDLIDDEPEAGDQNNPFLIELD